MKYHPIFLFLIFWIVVFNAGRVHADESAERDFDPTSHVADMLSDKCAMKASLFENVVKTRAPAGEHEEEMEFVLNMFVESWRSSESNLGHHEHVDMIRLVRDAYRTDATGAYRVQDARDFGIEVYQYCVHNGF